MSATSCTMPSASRAERYPCPMRAADASMNSASLQTALAVSAAAAALGLLLDVERGLVNVVSAPLTDVAH